MKGFRLAPVIVALAVLLSACGGGTDNSMPPLTLDPSYTMRPPGQSSRSADRQPGVAARAVLQRFLRGLGTADPKVCTLVTAAYAKAAFGKAACRAWITGKHLPAADRAALRGVEVPTGTMAAPARFTVAYGQLTWPGTAPAQRGPLRARFTLRKIAGHWRVAV
jgi:hypothetical protein